MRFPLYSALLLAALATVHGSDSWTQFRGPSQGSSDAKGVPLQWSETDHVKWKTPLPGQGWSSPVASGKQIWMTTSTDGGHSLRVLCCDFETGKLVLNVEVFHNDVPPSKHDRNSYASPTPILDGDRLYADFGEMGIACISTKDGQKIWENRELKVDHQNGPGGCSVLYMNKLLVACDGMDRQYGVALDKTTGKVLWKTVRSGLANLAGKSADRYKAYGTPVVFTLDGRAESLTCGAGRLYSYDPDTGKEIWCLDYPGFSNAPLPVFDGKQIYVCTGFMKPEIWALRASGLQGNVTSTHVAWKQTAGVPDQATPIVVRDRLYMVSSAGIASCLRTSDGSVVWKERVGPDFAASPLYLDGRIYFFDTFKTCKVVAPADTFKVLAKNDLEEGCMATPAVLGKALLVRTKSALYRIE